MKTLIHYILFLITLLVIGCSKTEDRVEAGITKPFLFDEMKLESMNGESIVFSSKLLEVNNDKITDHGIVIPASTRSSVLLHPITSRVIKNKI